MEISQEEYDIIVEEYYSEHAAKVRAKYLKRWAGMSKTNDIGKIDYTNPTIHLEFELCDVRNLMLISGGERRDEFLAKLTPEEQAIYLTTVGVNGDRYTDLEDKTVMKRINAALKRKVEKELKRRARLARKNAKSV